jgi:deazaflavin-dependent oxidoreductase (nitroreductase family)
VAIERNFWVELFWRWHPKLYRLSGGRIGGKMAGLPVLLIETIGRKSGERRETALTYLPYPFGHGDPSSDGDRYVVIASVLGEPRHPAWYLNLRADPKIAVTVGPNRIAVDARDAEGEERERIWDALIEASPDYAGYRKQTERRIPVVVLSRRSR